MYLKILILIGQVHLKNVLFVTTGIFKMKVFKFQPSVCNECRDVLMMSIDLNGIAILNIYCVDYRCNISGAKVKP